MPDPSSAGAGDSLPGSGSVRQVAYAFAKAALDVRASRRDIRIRSAALNQTRSVQASTSNLLGAISTSDLRSLVASRNMVQFLGALPPSEYEDVQLLLERAYALYQLEYEREYRRWTPDGSKPGVESTQSTSTQSDKSPTISDDDAILLQAFLSTVLDWVPLDSLRSGLLVDEDDYLEQRISDVHFDALHRQFTHEAKYPKTPPPSSLAEPSSNPDTTTSSAGKDAVHFKARALERVLDLEDNDDSQNTVVDEQLHAMIKSSDEAFLLSIQVSTPIRRRSKYLHIITKRCLFLLESSFRLRLMVQYARETPARITPVSRGLSARYAIWKLRDIVKDPSDETDTNRLLSGALPSSGVLMDGHKLRTSRSAAAASLELYDFDILSFQSRLCKRLGEGDVSELMEEELSTTHPEIMTRMPVQFPRPPTVHAALEALHRNAPIEGAANENFWRMVARGLPNLAGNGRAGPDDGVPFDARQIFQRRPREDFSLRQLILSLIPESARRAIYNTVVPGAIRILISTPEARGLVPGMLVHTGWLLFKVFILITVLTSRLGIPVPNRHPHRTRAQGAAGQGQGQGQQQNAAGANGANTAAKLTTLVGLLQIMDNALSFIGMPDLSTYWQMYSVCLAAAMFILWDMERWFNRRLEGMRREQRRNQRDNNVAGRAVPPPARVGAAGGAEGAGQQGRATPTAITPADPSVAGTSTDVVNAKKPPTAPPLHPPPVYSPRRMTILTRQRRERGQQIRFGLFTAMALGPGPLLKYTLECLAYYGMESEDEELGLILRSQAPFGAILDDNTGLIKSVYHPTIRAQSTRAAQRLRAPPRQVRILYADIEDETPGSLHRTGRVPLSLAAQQLAQDNQSRWTIVTTLALEVVWRLSLAFVLMAISLIPECEILRRRAIDRRTEVWRNARRREIERRAKEAAYRVELARFQEEQEADKHQAKQSALQQNEASHERNSVAVPAGGDVASVATSSATASNERAADGIRRRTAGEGDASEGVAVDGNEGDS